MLRKLWNIFVSICVVIGLLLVATMYIPRFWGIQTYVVTSGSMEPQIPVGSLVYVEKVEPTDIEEGDVITFYLKNTNIVATHQVYEVDAQNQLFRTQGINNHDDDGNILHDAEPVYYNSLIGKMKYCIPVLGNVNRFCTTAPGYYFLMAVVIGIVAISIIVDLIPQQEASRKGKFIDKENT